MCQNIYACQIVDPDAISIEACIGPGANCVTDWYKGVIGTVPMRRYCAPVTALDYSEQSCYNAVPEVTTCVCNLDLCNDNTNAP